MYKAIKNVFISVSHSSSPTSILADEEIHHQHHQHHQHHHQHQHSNNNINSRTLLVTDTHVTIMDNKQIEGIPPGLFQEIPSEVVENHIFSYMDYVWFFRVACLVCKEWNQLCLNTKGGLRMIFEDDEKCSSFLSCCHGGRFRSVTLLTIAGNLLPKYLMELVECEKLESLESLDVGFHVGIAGPLMIGNSKLPNLKNLNFNGNKIGCDGLRQLSKGSSSKKLKHLGLIDNYIGVNGIMFLSNSNLCNLSYLDLSNNRMSNEALKFLSNGKLPLLVSLILKKAFITNQGATQLVSGSLQNLTELDLQDNNISDEGGKSIANGKLQHLIVLNLSKNNISMDVASTIFTSISTLKNFQWKTN